MRTAGILKNMARLDNLRAQYVTRVYLRSKPTREGRAVGLANKERECWGHYQALELSVSETSVLENFLS